MTADDASELVEVFSSQGHLQANVVKAKLEASGIPVLLEYDSLSLVFGLTVDGIGAVRVLVPRDQVLHACELIREQRDQPDDDESPLPD